MSQEINTFDSQDLARFLGIEPNEEQTTQVLVDYDYEEVVRKVRQGYVDLLNDFGNTRGDVVEERQWPNPRKFSMFRITSKRSCPPYEQPFDENSKVTVDLESFEHTDIKVEPYDPKTLTKIFPGDMISLEFHLYKRLPNRIIFQNLDFYISTNQVVCWKNTIDSDENLSARAIVDRVQEGKGKNDASPKELEMLLTLRPMLEAYYQSIRPALPASSETVTESKPRFRLSFPKLLMRN